MIWAGALMLNHLGHLGAASGVMQALEDSLVAGLETRDLRCKASTEEAMSAVIERLPGSRG